MKYSSLIIIGIASLLLLLSCKSSKLGPVEYEKQQIRFGSGGGFTGAVNTFALLASGKLYQHNSMGADTFAFMLELPKSQMKDLFSRVEESGLDTTKYNTYGNFYHFLEWKTESDSNRISWSSDDVKIDSTWKALYKELKQLSTPLE